MSTKKLVLVPSSMKSQSAKRLAASLSQKLGYKVWRVSPERVRRRIPFVLRKGTDKLTQLTKFKEHGIDCPDFTTNRANVLPWLADDSAVVCRTLLRSSEGKGIVIATEEQQLVNAPLYTKYVPKKRKYRVHIVNGVVIDVQEKRKKRGFENDRDTRVRNTANGYVFCRENVQEPDGLRAAALQACSSLGYSLGAVDVAYNERNNRCVVLEVNANPGLEGTTLEKYSSKIVDWYKERVK